MAQQPPVDQSLLIVEDSWSHSDTPHSVGLLWTSDQPVAETFTWQHNTQETNIHAYDGIRTHNPSKRAAADPRLWPRGHWGRCVTEVVNCYFSHLFICARNDPLFSGLSSLITFLTWPCVHYPFLPVLASRTASYLIHQSFFKSSLTSFFLWFPFENFPWQSISWHSLYVSKLP